MTDNMNNTKSCADPHLCHQSKLFDENATSLASSTREENLFGNHEKKT